MLGMFVLDALAITLELRLQASQYGLTTGLRVMVLLVLTFWNRCGTVHLELHCCRSCYS